MKEIIFQIEEDEIDGGYIAKAIGFGITTQAETIDELKELIIDAVKCHFEEDEIPKVVNLHYVKNELIKV